MCLDRDSIEVTSATISNNCYGFIQDLSVPENLTKLCVEQCPFLMFLLFFSLIQGSV